MLDPRANNAARHLTCASWTPASPWHGAERELTVFLEEGEVQRLLGDYANTTSALEKDRMEESQGRADLERPI